MEISPFAPNTYPQLPAIDGVRLAYGRAGVRYKNRDDIMLMTFDEGTVVGGVFTRSSTAGPPVRWCRTALKGGLIRACVVNSGNANVFTGAHGEAVVAATVAEAAKLVGCPESEVFVSSTGVIGEPPDAAKITAALPGLHAALTETDWMGAARAICTTDTFPKLTTLTVSVNGVPVTINGIAKGSGMVAPDMATMLVYYATDAAIDQPVLQECLKRAVDVSYNAITVDSDTSTSDTVLVAATGKAGNETITDIDSPAGQAFLAALTTACQTLAKWVVKDGEGASKFVEVRVMGAASNDEARTIGLAIANSPLVKTAIAGEDANWGRVVAAIGKSKCRVNEQTLSIGFGGIAIAANGGRVEGYDESLVDAHLKGREITLEVDLGIGSGTATIWTCDFTEGYIRINADYRS